VLQRISFIRIFKTTDANEDSRNWFSKKKKKKKTQQIFNSKKNTGFSIELLLSSFKQPLAKKGL
jgi:hypothetical protein